MSLKREGTLAVAGVQRPFAVDGGEHWHCLQCNTLTPQDADAFGEHECSDTPVPVTAAGKKPRPAKAVRTTPSAGDEA